ncbi:MFS transporter [Dactylosporangium sp. CS-033363]|uniref:MFS transporter n=1 Tax=Dactylosporangium sp. CS-033363 TaxID=3239935 RepID=UPI003D8A65C1
MSEQVRPGRAAPLFAAGFVTAFGAHSVAASLGGFTAAGHASLLALGLLLAVYDGAEIVLKPVFGALADRIGPRPVLLGGLLAFAAASAAFVLADNTALVGATRLLQGAAAAAFSPAAGALVARLQPSARHGRAFGSYGAWKGLGYTTGPLLGGGLVTLGGYRLLFATLAVLALAVAVWAAAAVPSAPPLPKIRQTIADLARRLTAVGFVRPTVALAGSTAALSVGVGFLPVAGHHAGLPPLATGAVVSLLALVAAVVQPWAGRARDAGRIGDGPGMATGLLLAAAGLGVAAFTGDSQVTGWITLVVAALAVGAGTGLVTPLGFAHLAANTPQERLGQTMGAAEVGREFGDAGGPLLVGAIAAAATLGAGLGGLAVLLGASAALLARARTSPAGKA